MTPLRSFARRSRSSLHRFSVRSRRPFQRRSTGTSSTPVNSYFTNNEDRDTDTLSDGESQRQGEICERTSETDSPMSIPEEPLDEDADATDGDKDPDVVLLPELISTPLLDTSTQRSKAQLNRKRNRSRPSRSFCLKSEQTDRLDWRVHDSTDENEAVSTQQGSDFEDKEPKTKTAVSPPPPAQKVLMFPGLSPAALLAGIKKRTGGGAPPAAAEETEKKKETEETESQNEEVAPPASQQSPRLPGHLAGAARVLPPVGSKVGGGANSPAWLKELKSKKRTSQHGGKT